MTDKSEDNWTNWTPGFYPVGSHTGAEFLRGQMRRDAWNHLHVWWKAHELTPPPVVAHALKADVEAYIKTCIPGISINKLRENRN